MLNELREILRASEEAGFRVVETDKDGYAYLTKGENTAYIELNEGLGALSHIDYKMCLKCGKEFDMNSLSNELREYCDCLGKLIIQGKNEVEL